MKQSLNQKYWIAYISIILIACILWFYNTKLYGDIMRLLPLYIGIILIIYKRYSQLVFLIGTTLLIAVITAIIKYTCVFIAQHYGPEYIIIAQRPINGEFNGFPSGHSSAAFGALGFILCFYAKRWGIIIAILAFFGAFSRVVTLWHTPLQIFVGACIGLLFSILPYLIVKKYYNLTKTH